MICCCYTDCKADEHEVVINENNFPDSTFRQYVIENIDTNHNGVLSLCERACVREIDNICFINAEDKTHSYDAGVHNEVDLKGINFFMNLKKLYIHAIEVKNLEQISGNPQLEELTLESNEKCLWELPSINSVKKLVIRGNIWKVDLGKMQNVEEVELINTAQRKMQIELTKNVRLKRIKIDSLSKQNTKLDFSENRNLEEMQLNIKFSKLIFPKKNNVEKLFLKVRQKNQNMILKNQNKLKDLKVELVNKNNVRKLLITKCPRLKSVVIKGKGKLKEIKITKAKKLGRVFVEVGKSLRKIWFKKTPNVKSFGMSGRNVEKVNLNSLRKLKYIDVDNCGLQEVDLRNLNALKDLKWKDSNCRKILFANNKKLEEVDISNNRIKGELDLSDMVHLWNFNCRNNKITGLYAGKQLKEFNNLFCENNRLKKLNFYNTFVERIYAKNNPTLKEVYLRYDGGVDFHFDKGVKKHYKEK